MKLYVIRHGQTNSNKNKIFNCQYDEDINEIGIKEAQSVIDSIQNKPIDLIICSPLKRTIHTMNIININNIPVIYDSRLIERNGGELTLTKYDDQIYQEFFNYYSKKKVPSLESLPDLFKRVHSLLDEIKIKYPDKNILLVTHGGVARAIKYYFEPIPKDGLLSKHKEQENCEIIEYIL